MLMDLLHELGPAFYQQYHHARLCWSVPTFSLMLLTRTDSAPTIHLSLKFRLLVMLFQNIAHVEHFDAVNVAFFPTNSADLTLKPAQVSVLNSQELAVRNSSSFIFKHINCFRSNSLHAVAQRLRCLFFGGLHVDDTHL